VSGNPYRIEGPALISFSGGRTSGYMLWHILDAHGGQLPEDVHVCFANTGKEREETLRFVHECATRWGVRVRWLEYRDRRKRTPVEQRFEEVGYNSASRNGEPFEALILSKKQTPNQEHRWCTEHLKVLVMLDFMRTQGREPGTYQEAVGLRADEQWRYFKMLDRNERDGRQCIAPLVRAGVSKADVMAFWAAQPFDLGLKPVEGNCDLCFLKGRNNLSALIRQNPASADWWSRMEQATGPFSSRYSIAQLARDVDRQPMIPDFEEFDAECGLWCAGEAA
jgi:3'-phosphoadenosine 5'-phosphosulfate sulfotransferase (PAPS reductase)/FAD synthetase